MLGLCCDKTYGAITNCDDGYDDRYNDGNEDGNNNGNADSGLGYDGMIFDLIVAPQKCLGLVEEDQETTKIEPRTWHHIYLRVGIYLPYKYYINIIVSMCNYLLYAKLAVWTYASET